SIAHSPDRNRISSAAKHQRAAATRAADDKTGLDNVKADATEVGVDGGESGAGYSQSYQCSANGGCQLHKNVPPVCRLPHFPSAQPSLPRLPGMRRQSESAGAVTQKNVLLVAPDVARVLILRDEPRPKAGGNETAVRLMPLVASVPLSKTSQQS